MRFRSISRKFRHFCISFAAGLLLTFLLSQLLLQYFAHWSEQTLHTQETFSLYWNVIGELDNSLYIISQTPTEELTDEAREMSGKLLEYASLLEERFGDSRGQDLRVLTEHLNRETDRLNAAEKEEISAAADEAQARIQVLRELYEGFYESM